MKKIIITIIVIIIFLFATCEPSEPPGDVPPYMSDVVYIPAKVYAKGKLQKIKKKSLKGYESLGKFTLTAYCGCTACCGKTDGITSTGTKTKAGRTVAVDPKVIPYGTELVINGHKYVAEDCGGGIKGNHIDIYFNSHSDAIKFGKQKAVVYKRKEVKKWVQKKHLKIKLKNISNTLAAGKLSFLLTATPKREYPTY